ncbi:tetratricopeptide repeat protein [candidate division KSB1 bacterium]
MRKIRTILLVCCCALLAVPAVSQVANQSQIGARPMGMGGAFSAIANDANAIFWNPAGIATLQRQEITTMYSDPYGLGIAQSYLGYVLPITDNQAAAVDWMHHGFDDSELGFSDDNFHMAYGLRLPWNVAVGAKMKFTNMDITLDGTSYGKSSGFGFDFGVLATPFRNLRLALVVNDLGGTSVTFDNDVTEEIYKQQFRVGAAYTPFEGLTVAADVDDRVHMGAEYWLSGIIGLRGGLQHEIEDMGYDRGLIWSAGISAKYRFMQFDYALENDPLLPMTQRFGVSFYYNPALVSIKNATIRPVPFFRSLYRRYSDDEEFAEVVLKNSSQDPLPVRVQIDIPTVTSQPYEQEIVLDPQATKAYPLSISLSNEIIQMKNAAYDNIKQPILTVSYEQDKNLKQTSINLDPLYILGKNKISWSDPARVASFITPEDEIVDRFTRSIIQQYNREINEQFNNSNLGRALVLFGAIGKHGIVYQADQQTPWYLIQTDSTIFDNIQYPGELLASKIGDCDDCTVLFVSMLENLGIQTMMLDVFAPGQGHIYMMFDSGIPVDEVQSQPLNETEYVIYNDKVWIPVETTMYGHTFSAAWRNGAEEYHRMKELGYVNEINVAEARLKYRSGQPSTRDVRIPDKAIIDELVSADIESYNSRLEQFAQASGVSLSDPEGLYDAAAAYMRFNRLDDAERMLRRSLELEPDFGDAVNAMGVIFTRRGQYEEALQHYYRASELLPNDAGIRLNIAITLYLQGRRSEAEQEYDRAVEMDRTFKDLLKFLKGGGGE